MFALVARELIVAAFALVIVWAVWKAARRMLWKDKRREQIEDILNHAEDIIRMAKDFKSTNPAELKRAQDKLNEIRKRSLK